MTRMNHDGDAKGLFRELLGHEWHALGDHHKFDLGGIKTHLDGVLVRKKKIELAVEIESCGAKQVRGALLDLYLSDSPHCLLVIVKTYNSGFDELKLRNHYLYVWGKLDAKHRAFDVAFIEAQTHIDASKNLQRLRDVLQQMRLL